MRLSAGCPIPSAPLASGQFRDKKSRVPEERMNGGSLNRRGFVLGAGATSLALGSAAAQDAYPSHAITIISPFPPGGATEVVTRPLAAAMEPLLKQPLVIETKAGAA